MLYYLNEWNLSELKVDFYDINLKRHMTNFIGAEGIEWWKSLDFIEGLSFTRLKYSEDILERLEYIKNFSQQEDRLELELYIWENSIFYDTELFKELLNDNNIKKIGRVEYMKQFEELYQE